MIIVNSIQERDAHTGTILRWQALPDGKWRGYETEAELPPEPVVAEQRIVAAHEFRDRFTAAELGAIVNRAYSGTGDVNAQLLLLKVQTAVGGINLDSPEVIGGLDYLVSVGVIPAEAKARVLA